MKTYPQPTEPGYYWACACGFVKPEFAEICEVCEVDGALYVREFGDTEEDWVGKQPVDEYVFLSDRIKCPLAADEALWS